MRVSSLSPLIRFRVYDNILLVSGFNMLDAVLTVFALQFGLATEFNPLMSAVIYGSSMLAFIFLKLFISLFLLASAIRLEGIWFKVDEVTRWLYVIGSYFCLFLLLAVCFVNTVVILF